MKYSTIYKKYLKESTITYNWNTIDGKGIQGDDDFPTGNILIGDKFKKTGYHNRLTSFNINWILDDGDWKWNDFDAAKGQGSTKAYHDTLTKGSMKDRLFGKRYHTGSLTPVPKSSRALGNDLGPFTDAWGNPMDAEKTADTDEMGNVKEDVLLKINEALKKPSFWEFFFNKKNYKKIQKAWNTLYHEYAMDWGEQFLGDDRYYSEEDLEEEEVDPIEAYENYAHTQGYAAEYGAAEDLIKEFKREFDYQRGDEADEQKQEYLIHLMGYTTDVWGRNKTIEKEIKNLVKEYS